VWFNYPVEKLGIRFYRYKFEGHDKEVVIEANNKQEARTKLIYVLQKHPILRKLKVIDESVTLPVIGRTTKIIDNIEYVWAGRFSPKGWVTYEEYEKLNLK